MMLRHPWRTLGVAAILIALLVGYGVNLNERLSPSTIEIGGTQASRANELLRRNFGDTALFPILLRGPAREVDRQGQDLVRFLRRDPRVTALSPWDPGAGKRLRPGPGRALILVDFHVGINDAVDTTVPFLERTLADRVSAPVHATQTGFATISKAIQDESISAAEHAELIALPILLVVLLLVFRSPIAALIPLTFGAVSVGCSRGLLALLTHWFSVDALALTVCTMMGLALGVDYSLLMVSRFREELAGGASASEAARRTRRTAGRTTIFAGSTLVLSMVVAIFVVPGALLASLAGTLALVVLLTVAVAVLVGPPVLVVLGRNIDRWRIGSGAAAEESGLMSLVGAALKRPAPVAAIIGGVVLVLAAPAVALKTGPLSTTQLPRGDSVRRDAELIARSVGRGFEAPFSLVVASQNGPITSPAQLAEIGRWQRKIASLPGVNTVLGPRQISKGIAPVRRAGRSLLTTDPHHGPLARFARLGTGLGQAATGVAVLRNGLSRATYGASALAGGSGVARSGASRLAAGLSRASAKSIDSQKGLKTFAAGAHKLANGQARAANGALLLKLQLPSLASNPRINAVPKGRRLMRSLDSDATTTLPTLEGLASSVSGELLAASQGLEEMTDGRTDPKYSQVVQAVRNASQQMDGAGAAGSPPGLGGEIHALGGRLGEDLDNGREVTAWLGSTIAGVEQLSGVAQKLSDGLNQIKTGGERFATGATRIKNESGLLAFGLGRFKEGADQLDSGLGQISAVSSRLGSGLGEGFRRSGPIQQGLQRASKRVGTQATSIDHRIERLRHGSPGIFNSGYLALAALDGSRGRAHERASEAVSLGTGGEAASLLVISRFPFNSHGSAALNQHLDQMADRFERKTGLRVGVAGFPPTLNTYSSVTRERMPWVIAAITIATFLILILVLRAVPLAALAVGLNLATVAVAFGILTLLTNVPASWPLGGRAYIDAVGATMIFGVVFGLSIDYAVFLLVRMREQYDKTGDHAAAIHFGLEKTARVITGAAAIMMAVFIAFAGAPIATVSQLGIGLTVAVILDATVVRIVLLPALMLLAGERIWWLPGWLGRLLPRLSV